MNTAGGVRGAGGKRRRETRERVSVKNGLKNGKRKEESCNGDCLADWLDKCVDG